MSAAAGSGGAAVLGGGDKRKRKLDIGGGESVDTKSELVVNGGGAGDKKQQSTNPWTGKPYTDAYRRILKTREGLPVWQFREEFNKTVAANQVVILVGETGSGKTTRKCNTTNTHSCSKPIRELMTDRPRPCLCCVAVCRDSAILFGGRIRSRSADWMHPTASCRRDVSQ